MDSEQYSQALSALIDGELQPYDLAAWLEIEQQLASSVLTEDALNRGTRLTLSEWINAIICENLVWRNILEYGFDQGYISYTDVDDIDFISDTQELGDW